MELYQTASFPETVGKSANSTESASALPPFPVLLRVPRYQEQTKPTPVVQPEAAPTAITQPAAPAAIAPPPSPWESPPSIWSWLPLPLILATLTAGAILWALVDMRGLWPVSSGDSLGVKIPVESDGKSAAAPADPVPVTTTQTMKPIEPEAPKPAEPTPPPAAEVKIGADLSLNIGGSTEKTPDGPQLPTSPATDPEQPKAEAPQAELGLDIIVPADPKEAP